MSEVKTSRAPEIPPSNAWPRQVLWFGGFIVALSLAFVSPLLELVRFASDTSLHSHALLIPFISAYLIWLQRGAPLPKPSPSPALAVVPLAVGLVALKAILFPSPQFSEIRPNDYLALTSLSYVCLLWTGALFLLGWPIVRRWFFPLAFLILIVPLPTVVENAVEVFFQHTSADASALLFGLVGMTFHREGLVFDLPGMSIQVAQECSGIRSSLVLFITSLLAGHMFLKSPWRRAALTFFVIPLAIVRNGFRIVTIGMLCVHVDPAMIDSWIHRQGGPVFFALSLVPFFLLLFWLRRSETPKTGIKAPQEANHAPQV